MGFSQSVTFVATDTKLRSNEMTREEAKDAFLEELKYILNTKSVSKEVNFKFIDKIFNGHETQLKAKDEEIEKLKTELDNMCNGYNDPRAWNSVKDDDVFDTFDTFDSEAQLKAKDEKLQQLDDAYSKVVSDFESAVMEIEKLKEEVQYYIELEAGESI